MPFGKATEMARKADGSSHHRPSASLASLRTQVDRLDQQILKLINERARIAVGIGKVKQDRSGDVFAPAREDEVLQNLLSRNQGLLEPMTVRAIDRELMTGPRPLQRLLKVRHLGG